MKKVIKIKNVTVEISANIVTCEIRITVLHDDTIVYQFIDRCEGINEFIKTAPDYMLISDNNTVQRSKLVCIDSENFAGVIDTIYVTIFPRDSITEEPVKELVITDYFGNMFTELNGVAI